MSLEIGFKMSALFITLYCVTDVISVLFDAYSLPFGVYSHLH